MVDLEPLENAKNSCCCVLSGGQFVGEDFSSRGKTMDNEITCLEMALWAEYLEPFLTQLLFPVCALSEHSGNVQHEGQLLGPAACLLR